MTAAPRVAVVVPCFDDGATLPETLASVRQQEPCELVIVDDGSTDPATLRLLDELRVSGVRVLRQENAGPSAARNAGTAATTAPYVHPLDADDLLAEGALAALADALDAHPDAAVAWGDLRSFGDAERLRRSGRSLDPWQLTYMNVIPGTSLIRRERLVEAGGWQLPQGLRAWHEDWDLWLSFAERGWKGVHVPRVVLWYRVHGGRMLGQADLHFERVWRELEEGHPDLFARRRSNWRRSTAPWRLKLVLPVVEVLPLSRLAKRRVANVLADPLGHVAVRARRALGGVARGR